MLLSKSVGHLPIRFALYNFKSEYFNPIQLITHMFMHGGFGHIFFNMFAVFMFGRVIENVWGSKRFFILYMLSGIGAALLQLLITNFQLDALTSNIDAFQNAPSPDAFWAILKEYSGMLSSEGRMFAENYFKNPDSPENIARASGILQQLFRTLANIPMVGASGAVFGILAAFAMLFPNVELMLIFLPIPIKAKYFVPIYAVLELFFGIANFSGDNIAHFAHLGGAVVGFILVKIWKKNQFKMY
ncbi:MAG: rhomboid family intramembrane serine protease [Bacteroidales bacterium]|nr:rhomboid family intramembrane serine protease [Bacteroidales bacterium]